MAAKLLTDSEEFGDGLASDNDWIKSAEKVEANIASRALKFAAVGTLFSCMVSAAAFIALLSADSQPPWILSIDNSMLLAALGIFITASTLLAPVSFSIAIRIRDDKDSEIAKFIWPIASTARAIGVFSPAIYVATIITSATNQVSLPLALIGLASTAFVCTMCSLTVEVVELGPSLNRTRYEKALRQTFHQRLLAARLLCPPRVASTRIRVRRVFIAQLFVCITFYAAQIILGFLLFEPSHEFQVAAALSSVTLGAVIALTYSIQLEFRRNDIFSVVFSLLFFALWMTLLAPICLRVGKYGFTIHTAVTIMLAITIGANLFSLPLAMKSRASVLSIRRAVHERLIRDANEATSKLVDSSPTQPPKIWVWYRLVTGKAAVDSYVPEALFHQMR